MHKQTKEHLIGCEYCKRKIPFEIPRGVIDACEHGKLVIFAGAGVSTEKEGGFPFSLYDDIRQELGISGEISFPTLMSKYVAKTGDKRALLNKIKDRVDYTNSFPMLHAIITDFHRELSTIHQIQEIITTNWDDFFEQECSATPIVTDKDFAFWDQPFRKVFKLHGSINNPGSIVATEEDYRLCYKRLNSSAVGGAFKHLLATKTIVFLGYAFKDPDFKRIYRYLHKNMGSILPHSYFVTLSDIQEKDLKEFSPTIIKTDATFFLSTLKQKLIKEKQLTSDEIYSFAFYDLVKIKSIHLKLSGKNIKRNPALILCLAYQDGLIHALERAIQNKSTGEYSHICRIESSIKSYFKFRKAFLKKRHYFDVAYIDGYLVGLFQFIPEMKKKIGLPIYYIFGAEPISTYKDFIRKSRRVQDIHKSSYLWAEKASKKYKNGIVLQHSTFLMGVSQDEI